jgi:hypothetical protein
MKDIGQDGGCFAKIQTLDLPDINQKLDRLSQAARQNSAVNV